MNLIDIKERLVLGEKLAPDERDYVLEAINAYRPTKTIGDEIATVWNMADEAISIAVQHVMLKCQKASSPIDDARIVLIGIEIALRRQAARFALYRRDLGDTTSDEETFVADARAAFREISATFDAFEKPIGGRK